MIHKIHDEANKVLKARSSSECGRKFYTSSLHQFPVNHALCGIFMNSCVWASVHLSKDEDVWKRIVENLEVQRIQTVFETVQAQISNVRLRDQEISWPIRASGLDRWLFGGSIRNLTDEPLYTSNHTVHVSNDSVLCLGGRCPDHPEAARTWEKYRITCECRKPRVSTTLRPRK